VTVLSARRGRAVPNLFDRDQSWHPSGIINYCYRWPSRLGQKRWQRQLTIANGLKNVFNGRNARDEGVREQYMRLGEIWIEFAERAAVRSDQLGPMETTPAPKVA
jgi:hypothetical protein